MGRIHLITGGTRSGKSDYARSLAEAIATPRVFIATAEAHDDAMRARIERHRAERAASNWRTVEAPLDLAAAIVAQRDARVVLVDCLTVWITNHLCATPSIDEAWIAQEIARLVDAATRIDADVFFVSGEVGLGGIAANELARRFADLLGRANQLLAARADRVTLVACGLPLCLKGSTPA